MTYTCPQCGAISYDPRDAQERYCGRCHAYEDDRTADYFRMLERVPDPEERNDDQIPTHDPVRLLPPATGADRGVQPRHDRDPDGR